MATTDRKRELNRERQRRFRARKREARKAESAPAHGVAENDGRAYRARRTAGHRLAEARKRYADHIEAHPVQDVLAWSANVRTPFIARFDPPKYIEAIMLLAAHGPKAVRTVAVRKGAQLGFTSAFIALAGHGVSRGCKSVVIAQPTDGDCKAFARECIAPMFETTEELALLDATQLRGRKAALHRVYESSTLMLFGGGTSAGAWRRWVADLLLLDELDALPATIKGAVESEGEGDPVELARRPLRTRGGRLLAGGTPTASAGPSRVVSLVESCDLRLVYAVRCPACGEHTDLQWERLTWTDESEPLHECGRCGEAWPWDALADAVEGGRWIESEPAKPWPTPKDGGRWLDGMIVRTASGDEAPNPAAIGFDIHSLYSVWTPWCEFVSQWLAAQRSPERLRVFVEQVLAREFAHETEGVEAPALKAKAVPVDVPPTGWRRCVVGVDVQASHLVAVTTYWREPQRLWIVDRREFHGGIEPHGDSAWSALTTWLAAMADRHPVTVACDIGYRQTDCLRALGAVRTAARVSVRPCKGVDGWHKPWFSARRTASGVPFGVIGTYPIKQWLLANLGGDLVTLADSLTDEAFAELASEQVEYRRRRGRKIPAWIQTGANEALDCCVYASAVWASMYRPALA